MLELAIGTRFYFDKKLFEVVEGEDDCSSCIFSKRKYEGDDDNGYLDCDYAIACCSYARTDKKDVIFKEVLDNSIIIH